MLVIDKFDNKLVVQSRKKLHCFEVSKSNLIEIGEDYDLIEGKSQAWWCRNENEVEQVFLPDGNLSYPYKMMINFFSGQVVSQVTGIARAISFDGQDLIYQKYKI